MLKALHIGNFKAFGEVQHIPIRPITLIYGANSSGKSSILHSLLLANHALFASDRSLDVHYPRLSNSVDLGGFRHYIHQHDPQSHFTLGVDTDITDLPVRTAEFFSPAKQVSLFYNVGGPMNYLTRLGDFVSLHSPHVASFMLLLDKALFLTARVSGNIIVNTEHPFCLALVGRILEEADLPG